MKADQLKKAIDRMVRESILEILPDVMNEYLLRVAAGAGRIAEYAPAPQARRRPAPQAAPRSTRPKSLEALLQGDAGVDFYNMAEQRMAPPPRQAPPPRAPAPVYEDDEDDYGDFAQEEEPRQSMREQAIAQRISNLPPQFQALARETLEEAYDDDDGGEMWEENEFAPGVTGPSEGAAPPLNIDHAARVAGVDFSRAQQLIRITEQKAKSKVDAQELHDRQQWEIDRLRRAREALDRKA